MYRLRFGRSVAGGVAPSTSGLRQLSLSRESANMLYASLADASLADASPGGQSATSCEVLLPLASSPSYRHHARH